MDRALFTTGARLALEPSMTPEELRRRTKAFSIDVVRVCRMLPRTDEARIMGHQLLRAGTGVGANYRAVCRCRSDPDFIAKLGIVLEEADEAGFWLEILVETSILEREVGQKLQREADELTRISVSSRETARRNARARARARARNQIKNHESRISLFDRDALREVPRLVDVAAAAHGDVVREKLERNRHDDRRQQRRRRRHGHDDILLGIEHT